MSSYDLHGPAASLMSQLRVDHFQANVLDPINTVTFVFHNLYVQWLAISNSLELSGILKNNKNNCRLKQKQKRV